MARTQAEIPGTERPHDEELSSAIADLQELRAQRTEIKGKVDSAAQRLEEMMNSRGITEYIDPELEAKVALSESTRLSLTAFKVKETSLDGEAAE